MSANSGSQKQTSLDCDVLFSSCPQLPEPGRRFLRPNTRDYLTGLYNRRFFFDSGRKTLAATKRMDGSSAVAMLDIDHFKNVNDTYGHEAGGEVLR